MADLSVWTVWRTKSALIQNSAQRVLVTCKILRYLDCNCLGSRIWCKCILVACSWEFISLTIWQFYSSGHVVNSCKLVGRNIQTIVCLLAILCTLTIWNLYGITGSEFICWDLVTISVLICVWYRDFLCTYYLICANSVLCHLYYVWSLCETAYSVASIIILLDICCCKSTVCKLVSRDLWMKNWYCHSILRCKCVLCTGCSLKIIQNIDLCIQIVYSSLSSLCVASCI